MNRRTWLIAGIVLASSFGAILTWFFWPEPSTPPPRERAYLNSTACLLTDDRGLAGEQANAAWSGMQNASLQTRVKVQYLSVSGPQTPANAGAYFNSLALQKCQLIIAVGDVQVAAMIENRQRFPESRFAAVGGDIRTAAVTVVDTESPDTIRASVQRIVNEVTRG